MKYERSIIIGRGALTDVYRGRQNNSGQIVAMKGLKDEYCVGDLPDRFELEGQLGGQLSHPNIVQVFDAMRDKNRPYLILESLEGETLQTRVMRGALPEEEAIGITRQILEGLNQAHRQGIAHRDLKSSNIFLCRDGSVKIMDFGLSEIATQVERTFKGVRLRDPLYLSPEQLRGESSDSRSDIFSVGVLMYEMLKGDVPFQGANARAVWQAQGRPPEQLPVWVSPTTRAIVFKALRKEPIARFAAAAEMATTLRNPAWRDPDTSHDDPFAEVADPILVAREAAQKRGQERQSEAVRNKTPSKVWLVLAFTSFSILALLFTVLRQLKLLPGVANASRPTNSRPTTSRPTTSRPTTSLRNTPKNSVAPTLAVPSTPKANAKATAQATPKPTSQPSPKLTLKPPPVAAISSPKLKTTPQAATTPVVAKTPAATPKVVTPKALVGATPEELVIKNPLAAPFRPRRARRAATPRRARVRETRPRVRRETRRPRPRSAPRRNAPSRGTANNLPF